MPASGATLSVLIPAFNEADRIGAVVQSIRRPHAEVIVIDGGSSDSTRARAEEAGAQVLAWSTGRGAQLRAGAERARGEVLLFLHADTQLPVDYVDDVRAALDDPDVVAGAFSLRIDSPKRSLRFIEKGIAWRSRVRSMPYGDQAVFVRRRMLEKIGGVPAIPAMEDYEMMRRLRRIGRIGIIDTPVVTSARRWEQRGVWRTTLVNQWCVVAYRLGVSPGTIARWRRGTVSHNEPSADARQGIHHVG